MASPLKTGKQSVDLTRPAARGSRIRRDPPPVVKEADARDPAERDREMAVIGIVAFALAIAIVIVGFSSVMGWSPSQYTVAV